MIATLKQHYECYHAGDLTALKKLYEYHAENCAKAAELTEDTRQREEYLKLAREWTEAAVDVVAVVGVPTSAAPRPARAARPVAGGAGAVFA
jgi:hypothetical protein